MNLNGKTAVVTGASRGFGRGIATQLAAEGVKTVALARSREALLELEREVTNIHAAVADTTDGAATSRLMQDHRPDILVLNAGALPTFHPLHLQTWDTFSQNWQVDVKGTFIWLREALLTPLNPGGVIVVISSGAALHGSPLSGSYASAKAAQMMLANYARVTAQELGLNLRVHSLIPNAPTPLTELGERAIRTFAAHQNVSVEAMTAKFSPPLSPERVAEGVIQLLTNPEYKTVTDATITAQDFAPLYPATVNS
ncbi:MAG: SDR family oxidoreductase [Deinococcota bacterium]